MATTTLRLISRTFGAVLVIGVALLAAITGYAQNAFDKGVPAESKGGLSSVSTYARDKLETVNLANGNLTMQFPLATVGGRGSVAYTVTLSYNSKLWSGQHDGEKLFDPFGDPHWVHHYSATYDDQTMTKPNLIALGSGWSILKGPAIRSSHDDFRLQRRRSDAHGVHYTRPAHSRWRRC
ncbi:MAG TPA: hypothetical protein VJH03_02850 [Blastocatellia bacterium]|nr:hypothetical protein [Blastocatellia bacterium]